jgi:hypothetical protein
MNFTVWTSEMIYTICKVHSVAQQTRMSYNSKYVWRRVHGDTLSWGTVLQAGKLKGRFPKGSSDYVSTHTRDTYITEYQPGWPLHGPCIPIHTQPGPTTPKKTPSSHTYYKWYQWLTNESGPLTPSRGDIGTQGDDPTEYFRSPRLYTPAAHLPR